MRLAKDGTRSAIAAVADAAASQSDCYGAIPALRAAIEPFDSVGPDYRAPLLDARRPSRTRAIEELPVALGMVLVAGGDLEAAVLGAVNYGRDSDSIASMAGAITGALGGRSSVPKEWAEPVADASRIDLVHPGIVMAGVARDVFAADAARAAEVAEVRRSLAGSPGR